MEKELFIKQLTEELKATEYGSKILEGYSGSVQQIFSILANAKNVLESGNVQDKIIAAKTVLCGNMAMENLLLIIKEKDASASSGFQNFLLKTSKEYLLPLAFSLIQALAQKGANMALDEIGKL